MVNIIKILELWYDVIWDLSERKIIQKMNNRILIKSDRLMIKNFKKQQQGQIDFTAF